MVKRKTQINKYKPKPLEPSFQQYNKAIPLAEESLLLVKVN
jgi:hypothetical protein